MQDISYKGRQEAEQPDLERILDAIQCHSDEKCSNVSDNTLQSQSCENESFYDVLRRSRRVVRNVCLDPRFVPGPRWGIESLRALCPSLFQQPALTMHLYTNGFVLNDQSLLHPYEQATTDMQDAINWARLVPPLSVLLDDLSPPPTYFHGAVLVAVHDHRPQCWQRPPQSPHVSVTSSSTPTPSVTTCTDEKHDGALTSVKNDISTLPNTSAPNAASSQTAHPVEEVQDSREVLPWTLLAPSRVASPAPRVHYLLLRPSYDTLVTDLSALTHTPLSTAPHQRARARFLQSRKDDIKARDRANESEKNDLELKKENGERDAAIMSDLEEDDLIAIEERLLQCTAGALCLRPDPFVHRVANALHFRRNLWLLSSFAGQGMYSRQARVVPKRRLVHTHTLPFLDNESLTERLRPHTTRLLAMLQHAHYDIVRRDEQEVFTHSATEGTRRRSESNAVLQPISPPRPPPPLRSRTVCFEINKGRDLLQLDLQPHPHTLHTPTTGPFDHYISGKLGIARGNESFARSPRVTEVHSIEFVVGSRRQAALFAQTLAAVELQQPGTQLIYDSANAGSMTVSPSVGAPLGVPHAAPIPTPTSTPTSVPAPPLNPIPTPTPTPTPTPIPIAVSSSLATPSAASMTTENESNTSRSIDSTATTNPSIPVAVTPPTTTPNCPPPAVPYPDTSALSLDNNPAYAPPNALVAFTTESPANNLGSNVGGEAFSSASPLSTNVVTADSNSRQKTVFATSPHLGANVPPQLLATIPKASVTTSGVMSRGLQQFSRPPPAIAKGAPLSGPQPPTNMPPANLNVVSRSVVNPGLIPLSSAGSLTPVPNMSQLPPPPSTPSVPPQLAYPPVSLRHSPPLGIVHSQASMPITTHFPNTGGPLPSNQIVASSYSLMPSTPALTSTATLTPLQQPGGGTGVPPQSLSRAPTTLSNAKQ